MAGKAHQKLKRMGSYKMTQSFKDYTNDLVVVDSGSYDLNIKFIEETELGRYDTSLMVFDKSHKPYFEHILELLESLDGFDFDILTVDTDKFTFQDSSGDNIEVTTDKSTVGVKFYEKGVPMTMMIFTREHIEDFKQIIETFDKLKELGV